MHIHHAQYNKGWRINMLHARTSISEYESHSSMRQVLCGCPSIPCRFRIALQPRVPVAHRLLYLLQSQVLAVVVSHHIRRWPSEYWALRPSVQGRHVGKWQVEERLGMRSLTEHNEWPMAATPLQTRPLEPCQCHSWKFSIAQAAVAAKSLQATETRAAGTSHSWWCQPVAACGMESIRELGLAAQCRILFDTIKLKGIVWRSVGIHSTSAARSAGRQRGRLSVIPPPVMWAIPLTRPVLIRGIKDLT